MFLIILYCFVLKEFCRERDYQKSLILSKWSLRICHSGFRSLAIHVFLSRTVAQIRDIAGLLIACEKMKAHGQPLSFIDRFKFIEALPAWSDKPF